MPGKQRTCKRRKVRINSDGYPNQEDMKHNKLPTNREFIESMENLISNLK